MEKLSWTRLLPGYFIEKNEKYLEVFFLRAGNQERVANVIMWGKVGESGGNAPGVE
jgi:hypothetical protein